MSEVKRYDIQGKFESQNGEGISLTNPKMVLEEDYDAKCHSAEVYFGSWKRTEEDLDAAQSQLAALREELGECKGEYDRVVNNVAALREELAEAHRQQKLRDEGPLCWTCGDQGYVHSIDGELRGTCDNCTVYELMITKQRLADAERRNSELVGLLRSVWECSEIKGDEWKRIDFYINPKPEACLSDGGTCGLGGTCHICPHNNPEAESHDVCSACGGDSFVPYSEYHDHDE